MIHEKGELRDASPMMLLLRVHERGLTGILHLKQDDTQKVFYFHRGRFTWAISNADTDRLETVLVGGGVCSSEAVAALGMPQTGEHIGKALVESGAISLEELIAATRDQLKQIVSSVLFWTRGNYQFTLDPPPDKIISLDLEIPALIWEILSAGAPMDPIWKVIGSLQIELVADSARVQSKVFSLPPLLSKTLERFSEPTRLEVALTRLTNQEKMPAVQAVYFLLAAGLLKRTDRLPPPAVEPPVKTPEAVESEFAARFYASDPGEDPPGAGPADAEEEPMAKAAPKRPLALLVIVALLLGGLLFLSLRQFLRPPRSQDLPPREAAVKKTQEPLPAAGRAVDKPPALPIETIAPPLPLQPAEPPGSGPTAPVEAKSPPLERIPEKPVVKKGAEPVAQELPAPSTSRSPLAIFQAGDYPAAARRWHETLKKQGPRYAILLEMICDPRWIREAYDLLPRKEDFFILEKNRESRTCFVVFCGVAASEADARARLAALPQTLWTRRDPPEIVELSRYL